MFPFHACEPPADAARKMCVPLIYNHQRKQNCKSHPQIFLIGDACNKQMRHEFPGTGRSPQALVPASCLLPWACRESWVGSMRSLWLPAEGQLTQEVVVHQKCWLPGGIVWERSKPPPPPPAPGCLKHAGYPAPTLTAQSVNRALTTNSQRSKDHLSMHYS